jgi:hypothetical protein
MRLLLSKREREERRAAQLKAKIQQTKDEIARLEVALDPLLIAASPEQVLQAAVEGVAQLESKQRTADEDRILSSLKEGIAALTAIMHPQDRLTQRPLRFLVWQPWDGSSPPPPCTDLSELADQLRAATAETREIRCDPATMLVPRVKARQIEQKLTEARLRLKRLEWAEGGGKGKPPGDGGNLPRVPFRFA